MLAVGSNIKKIVTDCLISGNVRNTVSECWRLPQPSVAVQTGNCNLVVQSNKNVTSWEASWEARGQGVSLAVLGEMSPCLLLTPACHQHFQKLLAFLGSWPIKPTFFFTPHMCSYEGTCVISNFPLLRALIHMSANTEMSIYSGDRVKVNYLEEGSSSNCLHCHNPEPVVTLVKANAEGQEEKQQAERRRLRAHMIEKHKPQGLYCIDHGGL